MQPRRQRIRRCSNQPAVEVGVACVCAGGVQGVGGVGYAIVDAVGGGEVELGGVGVVGVDVCAAFNRLLFGGGEGAQEGGSVGFYGGWVVAC